MDRVLKIINILLLSIVGMLLLTGVMVLVQGGKVDFKAADWWAALSAVATVGTFLVALAAFKKAPNWFSQKIVEDGYVIANDIIYSDIPEIIILLNKFRVKLTAYCFNLRLNLDREEINSSHTINLATSIDNLVMELMSANLKLRKKFSSLTRYKWFANEELTNKIDAISELILEANDLKSETDIDLEKVAISIIYPHKKEDLTEKEIIEFKDSVNKIIVKCQKLHSDAVELISSITDSNHPITYFFNLPK
ncbi:hypothetical protein [Leclercia adecarboxylata]|uniref:hypothetical protein n=1 Tax=Leclercia adecarboxylata TaxID=83655 RepID=UPI0013FD1BA3|nr:hypothetical protein [Leclercia adecarboxylata]QIM42030.1 hypothetical protein G7098_04445 [Leclercia adecarboxylata]